MSSASQASSSQRAAASSPSKGAKARIAVARVSGQRRRLGARLGLLRPRRRRRAGGGAPSRLQDQHALLAAGVARRAPGSGRRPAAAGRRSRTARIRRAWPETRFSPLSSAAASSVAAGGEAAVGGRPAARTSEGCDRHVGVFDLAEAVDQALPLLRFQQRRELGFGGRLRSGGSRRGRGRSGRAARSWFRRAGPRARSPGAGASSPAGAGRRGSVRRSASPGPGGR